MGENSDFEFSDIEIGEEQHKKIVADVLSLSKSQHVQKASRTEAALQISEFNLVKSVTDRKPSVHVDDLAKVLKTRKKHVEIGKKVESTKRRGRTLPKPLEKPQADRIKRSVGYEKNRFLLDRWEAFVTSMRSQAHQSFPLDAVEKLKVEGKKAATFLDTLTYKSKLQKELEKIDTEVEEYHVKPNTEENEVSLSLEDLKNNRKELAKLRARQSYKEGKARRQNKIKSKGYHRILRKERIKNKLKEFDELQKTNPEEALKKLGEIEKARALERFSLRHKSTGQWARSKQVRAKYDKESRQVLAEQLQISKDLTQKQTTNSDSEDEVQDIALAVTEPPEQASNTPWNIALQTKPNEVTSFYNAFSQYAVDQTVPNDPDLNITCTSMKYKEKLDKPIKKARGKKIDLTMPVQSAKQIIDEEMIEQPAQFTQNFTRSNDSISALTNILKTNTKQTKSDVIKQFTKPTVTHLNSTRPDIIVSVENVPEASQNQFISEGFEDFGIASDFMKEKKSEIEKDRPTDIDSNLPGWGSWAGSGIDPKKQKKRRRFMFKMPKTIPRRDDNKGRLIINEKAAKKVAPYLVSDIPFPFKSAKDYEASLRAPIGNSFVPELAFRRFIKPTVETKMGTIIEPVTTGILMGKPNK
ncbi:U3 small nucleolar RNA-associated protein 14 homolog A [Dendroctonus ponderosae]